MLMGCVSSSHHDCWVSRASVAPNQAEAVFPPIIQPQRCTKFTTVMSLLRSHTLKGGISKSYYRKSMKMRPIFIAIFGRHNMINTRFPDCSSQAWGHLITGSSQVSACHSSCWCRYPEPSISSSPHGCALGAQLDLVLFITTISTQGQFCLIWVLHIYPLPLCFSSNREANSI